MSSEFKFNPEAAKELPRPDSDEVLFDDKNQLLLGDEDAFANQITSDRDACSSTRHIFKQKKTLGNIVKHLPQQVLCLGHFIKTTSNRFTQD